MRKFLREPKDLAQFAGFAMRGFAKLHGADLASEVPRMAGVALLAGMAFTLLGPFHMEQDGFFVQIGFWTSMSALWFALSLCVAFPLMRSAWFQRRASVQQWLLARVLAFVPMVLIAGAALVALHGWRQPIGEVVGMIGRTLLIVLVLELLYHGMSERLARRRAPSSVADDGATSPLAVRAGAAARVENTQERASARGAPPFLPPLLKRLPPHARGSILCLQMEDHYVRVHTDVGSTLVLMRFSEALLETEGVAGLRVHRSWWVATNAIADLTKAGRTAQLGLRGGLSVPVSQPYLRDVRILVERAAAVSSTRWQGEHLKC
ncbi:LytTR family DNA-binding domain-containing protein [Sphingomonas sp. UYP23]